MKSSVLFVCAAVFLSAVAGANPTGSALLFFPVEPCRIMDTRVAIGQASAGYAYDLFVRGTSLPGAIQGGANNCGIPAAAEAVIVNIVVINPTGSGYLRINGTGFLTSPSGVYSRMNFTGGAASSEEMTVSLCNTFLAPHPHAPCLWGGGLYSDSQLALAGGDSHVVIDVMGYFRAAP